MVEDRGTSKLLERSNNNNNMNKRKRLDARAFRDMFIAKKHKLVSASTPESKDSKVKEEAKFSDERESEKHEVLNASTPSNLEGIDDDKVEANGSNEREAKKRRTDSEAKLQAGNGEAISSVPKKSQDLSDCKTKLPRFIEYWVPVGLSYVQLEKYCETLLKNSFLLCSNLKKEVFDGLHDILTAIRKCCDHPYLVDLSLQKFVNDGRTDGDFLSNGIEVSGKLLLLDKLLEEVKEKQLRVLIVFQCNDSKRHSLMLQHILDDFICAKVGEECYVQLYREFDSVKKRAEVDLFNDKENGKLVMLIEKSSCQPSIKLSSMDCVILFNSDWSPINDMKSLRKMSFQSKCDHLKVFRLYTINSVEEKALILAKNGTGLENNSNNFSHNISHMLLLWGASYLFTKLDELHSHCSSIANLNSLSEDKLVLDVLNELFALLSCQDSDNMSCSLVSKVREANDDYSRDITLHGEQENPARDDDLPLMAIWLSLLEGRNPQWKLLPGSSEKIRRRGELSAIPAQYVEISNKNSKMLNTKTSHSQDELCLKPGVQRVCGPAPRKIAGNNENIAGHPKSSGSAVKLSSGKDEYSSLSQIEETCVRRMRELILKQKKEIREFYKTKREERAKLEEEHQLKVDLMNQRYRETVLKQEKLKMLDLTYEKKLEEHNHQMDSKRKDLEDEHSASRIKEKQLKDKLLSLLKMKNVGTPTTSLVKLSLLATALGQQTVSVSESKHSQEIDLGLMNASVLCDNPGCWSDHVLTETDILSLESNEENDAVSMPTEEVLDTEKLNNLIPVPVNGASTSTSLCENQCQATLYESNRDIEGDGSTNMKFSKEIMHGMTPMCPVSGSLESDGENDVAVVPSEQALDTSIEVLNHGSNLCTSNEPQLHATTSGHSCAESNMPHREVQDGGCDVKALVGATIGEAEIGGAADLGTNVSVAGRQRIEQLQDGHCNTASAVGVPSREAVLREDTESGTNFTVAVQQRIDEEQGEDCYIEAAVGASNGESVMGSAADQGTIATLAVQQTIEELTELPSLSLNGSSEVVVQPQTCIITGNSSQLEQPMVSANLPCNENRQSAGACAVLNCQTSGVLALCQPGQTQAPSRNLGLCDQPVVRTQRQSTVGWQQTHILNFSATANLQSASNYIQGSSSLRNNLLPSSGFDPLQNELVRMKKEQEEVVKIHVDRMLHLKSACEKEIQEIHKKYDLLLREADNALVQKKLEMDSSYKKVYAHKLLADTLKFTNQKQTSYPLSQEALLGAVLQFAAPQQSNQRPLVASAEPTAPPVQVVHHLSELVSLDVARPQNCSTMNNTGNLLAGYHARATAPHLRPSRAVTSSIWTHGSSIQNYGTRQNHLLM